MISKSLEEYLKNMYVIKRQTGDIRVTDIAEKMNCTKASVNKALNNLKNADLVIYEPYGEIKFTEKGKELAKKVLEAYDIVYVFLKDVLNVKEEDVELEAEKMKSVLSDNTINELARYVHKVLDLSSLDCGYDINKEKCRSCARRKLNKKE